MTVWARLWPGVKSTGVLRCFLCRRAGEGFPAIDCDPAIVWIQLKAIADPPGPLGGDEGGAGAEKEIEDRVTGLAAVLDGPLLNIRRAEIHLVTLDEYGRLYESNRKAAELTSLRSW